MLNNESNSRLTTTGFDAGLSTAELLVEWSNTLTEQFNIKLSNIPNISNQNTSSTRLSQRNDSFYSPNHSLNSDFSFSSPSLNSTASRTHYTSAQVEKLSSDQTAFASHPAITNGSLFCAIIYAYCPQAITQFPFFYSLLPTATTPRGARKARNPLVLF